MHENKEQDRAALEGIVLEGGGRDGRPMKLLYNQETGLFQLSLRGEGEAPWVSGAFMRGKLSSAVSAASYAQAVEFIDKKDPQRA